MKTQVAPSLLPAGVPPLPPIPDEEARLAALNRYRILDTLPEGVYDDVVDLARALCGTPQAVLTFIDEQRQWFKAAVGLDGEGTDRRIAFCDVAIRTPKTVTVVEDASQHARFRHYPQVTGPDHLRFYAGAPLVTPDGHALGTVCVVDTQPRSLSDAQARQLQSLARLVVQLLEARRRELDSQRQLAERELHQRELMRYQRELESKNTELAEEARRDALTGLLNRGGLSQAARASTAREGDAFTVAVLDLDHFKRINDTLGHAAGDEVIRVAAEEIQRGVRGSDVAARYGGEEFLLLMPATTLDSGVAVVERIRAAIAARADLPAPVTLSAGLAAGLAGRDTPDSLFQRADQALYLAKRRGRDRVEVIDD
ncbi:GGDEF domain-containing protein [Arenimonas caeni]|jgi:diguanylate cyclase (GGDEF)-like protein|uniref:diguanylate cyclase n=1 Tax=Arenimonas caeni TaxID=2058085 RepID=A0A2P6MAA9_9GAMM|nr:sensor domain-containing diguanylate cyclase [Arenimonas caeni]MDY0021463.1 sensor domain-containing diguanylate cyclase [Arenimonas caeni]PRH82920.1 sensor domain-containing diguanylate cyclase [Arenimonas caeni]